MAWTHGFVDPLTGILLWVGIAAVAWGVARSAPRRAADRFMGGAFLFLWLLLALLINKAPSYCRLLVTLPFVAYLVVRGAEALAELVGAAVARARSLENTASRGTWTAFAVAIASIAVWNLDLVHRALGTSFRHGDERLGAIGRYIESYEHQRAAAFYVVADEAHPLYYWSTPSDWLDWFSFFATPDQLVLLVPPERFEAGTPWVTGASYIMRSGVWEQAKVRVASTTRLNVRALVPDGSVVAVEVL